MTSPTGVLAALDLTATGPDTFAAGPDPIPGMPRPFGGQLLAQALVAAGRTVDGGAPAHSLHAYFLRAGDPAQGLDLTVTRLRDGRRFASRSVAVEQNGRLLATLTASFTEPAEGLEHQSAAPPSPPPASLPTLAEWAGRFGGLSEEWFTTKTVDTRVVPDPPPGTNLVWHRLADPVPGATPLLHQALLVYLSDVTTLSEPLVPHGMPIGIESAHGRTWDAVSLDHAVWFHRPLRADDWLLFAQHSPAAVASRGLARADVYTPDGTLVASLAQEGLYLPS